MNYRLTHNGQTKGRFLKIALPFLFLGVIVLFHFFYPTLLGTAAARLATPFWNAERYLMLESRTVLAYFSSKIALEDERLRLSDELVQAQALLLDRSLLREENTLLKEQLGRSGAKAPRIIGAVLASPPRSLYDTIVLDIGAADGITVGDRALFGSLVFGQVSRVYAHTLIVDFFSTAGKKTPVLILHEGSSIPVEAVGEGGGAFIATLPADVTVSIGDSVVIPGMNPLVFSVVETIESMVTDSFAHIRFKNPIPFTRFRFLEIEKVDHTQ